MIPNINHILYATDLSEGAHQALGHAVGLANLSLASLTIIHVIQQTSPNAELLLASFLGYSSKEEIIHKSQSQIIEKIKSRLQQMCDELGCQLPSCKFRLAKIIVEFGQPQNIIMNHAETKNYDILVIGRHDYGVIERTLTGHATKGLLRHCPIPVLLVPVISGSSSEIKHQESRIAE